MSIFLINKQKLTSGKLFKSNTPSYKINKIRSCFVDPSDLLDSENHEQTLPTVNFYSSSDDKKFDASQYLS